MTLPKLFRLRHVTPFMADGSCLRLHGKRETPINDVDLSGTQLSSYSHVHVVRVISVPMKSSYT